MRDSASDLISTGDSLEGNYFRQTLKYLYASLFLGLSVVFDGSVRSIALWVYSAGRASSHHRPRWKSQGLIGSLIIGGDPRLDRCNQSISSNSKYSFLLFAV